MNGDNSISNIEYDIITDIPTFVNQRVEIIHHQNRHKLSNINRIIIMVNQLIEMIPNLYFTRSGCEVNNDGFQTVYSDHDSARSIGAAMIVQYNEVIIDLVTGSYSSAIISTRSILEWLIRVIAAVTDSSILTKKNYDKKKPICFKGLLLLMAASDANRILKRTEKQELLKELRNDKSVIETEYYERLLFINLPSGIGNLPGLLDSELFKYLEITQDERYLNMSGHNIIRELYKSLSEIVHLDLNTMLEIKPGGTTVFFNQEEFNNCYEKLLMISDVILYLYIITIDIDVFNSNKEIRREWRKRVRELFFEANLVPNDSFHSLSNLVNSKKWNSVDAISL